MAKFDYMKNKVIFFAVCIGLILNFSVSANAQVVPNTYKDVAQKESIDTDIRAMRFATMPNFKYSYDDYLQYSSGVLVLGLKSFGYEGRTKWGPMVVADAFSVGLMAGTILGTKYAVGRLRPDGSRHNSFPSGHTATAFTTATMLHLEYGWKSPWWSFGAYTVATATGLARIMNNRHYMSDVVVGAGVGIGAVHLGYYLSELIFKEKTFEKGYVKPEFEYDYSVPHYVAEIMFGRRFIVGKSSDFASDVLPYRGSSVGVGTEIPLMAGAGVSAVVRANTLSYKDGNVAMMYDGFFGLYQNFYFAKVLELQLKGMLGYGGHHKGNGLAASTGLGLSLITGNNFRLKAFADYNLNRYSAHKPWLNSFMVGYSTSFFW